MQGSKNLVGLEEFSLFISKLLEDFRHTKIQTKGILIGNGLCEKPPITRLGKLVFFGPRPSRGENQFNSAGKLSRTLLAPMQCVIRRDVGPSENPSIDTHKCRLR
jgi:hypothetical protein